MIKPYYEDGYCQLYLGDSRTVLSELPEKSVDCVMTSPPYYGLRSYKCEPVVWDSVNGCRHEWGNGKERLLNLQAGNPEFVRPWRENATDTVTQGQFCLLCGAWSGTLGMEPTPQLYIQHLVGIFDQMKRVLKDTGVIFVNLSDSYATHASGGKGYSHNFRSAEICQAEGIDQPHPKYDIPEKSLIGIPQRFLLAMIDRGWIARNEVIWFKRSCMPESVKDRFTRDFEHIYFFSKQQVYFFEQQFEAAKDWGTRDRTQMRNGTDDPLLKHHGLENGNCAEQGRNKRTTWDITSQGSKFDHYASYPPALCETPIKAGCPEYICPVCGKAREKMYETTPAQSTECPKTQMAHEARGGTGKPVGTVGKSGSGRIDGEQNFIGYSDCDCKPATRLEGCIPGVVLDPFMGTGTTLYEAKLLGRRSIGIDVSEEYVRMAVKRLKRVHGVQKALET